MVAALDPNDVIAPNADDVSPALAHFLTTGDVARMPGEHLLALYFEILARERNARVAHRLIAAHLRSIGALHSRTFVAVRSKLGRITATP